MSTPPQQPPDQPTQPGGWGPPPPDQPTQPGGWGPPPGPLTGLSPGKRPRLWKGRQVLVLALAVGAACLILGSAIGAAVARLDQTAGMRPSVAAATRPPATAAAEEPATTEPAAVYPEPKPSDFDLKVKVLKKENFGSAGSLVTFRIEAGWSKTYDPDETYEVTYEVRGPEDGPMVNTFKVTGDEYRTQREETTSTPSASTRLTARVTDVQEV
jgi:hypothetical protein